MLELSQFDSRVFDLLSRTSESMFIYLADFGRDFSRWSKPAVDYFGLPGEYIEDTANVWMSYIHPQDRYIFQEDMGRLFSGESDRHDCEYRARNAKGEYVWVRCYGIVERNADGTLGMFAGTMTNLGTSPKFDPITGLYSFDEFRQQMQTFLASDKSGVLLMIGPDRFRRINDLLGYSAGDAVLRRLADHCQGMTGYAFYRMSGDKIGCLIPNGDTEEARALFAQVAEIVRRLPEELGLDIQLSASCGAVSCPADGRDFETLHANAEYALEQAKRSGRGRMAFYSDSQHRKTVASFQLQEALRGSIADGFRGFSMNYQPLINAATDEIYGAEALMRYTLPDGTPVSPAEFIPVLEEDATICDAGEWALRTALAQTARWRKTRPGFCISVNVSYLQMYSSGFREVVMQALADSKLPPECLVLELTESCKIDDPERLQSDFEFFTAQGVRLALDDFGTGYSSIALLRELTPQWIKVDHTFVASIRENRLDQAILEYIMNLSRQAGISVCVEGVENTDILDFVRKFRPDLLQGYYFSKPCPPVDFEKNYIAK